MAGVAMTTKPKTDIHSVGSGRAGSAPLDEQVESSRCQPQQAPVSVGLLDIGVERTETLDRLVQSGGEAPNHAERHVCLPVDGTPCSLRRYRRSLAQAPGSARRGGQH